jgi:uncharacterized protein (TIGR03437 family)
MNGVRVRVGGQDTGLVFISPNQINFTISADLPQPAGPTSLELSNAGRTIAVAQVELAQTAPAVFTLNSSGQGPGAVLIAGTGLFAQSSANGRPARRGEAIEIYCTGLGREPVQAAVTIGGQAAEVLYAGRSGAGPEGLAQVNARVPQSAPIGAEVQLMLQVGGRISRAVTIAVAQEAVTRTGADDGRSMSRHARPLWLHPMSGLRHFVYGARLTRASKQNLQNPDQKSATATTRQLGLLPSGRHSIRYSPNTSVRSGVSIPVKAHRGRVSECSSSGLVRHESRTIIGKQRG